jgi:hypothetical protein
MARPRYDRDGNCIFDGKIGVCPYVEWVQAQKRSKNRFVFPTSCIEFTCFTIFVFFLMEYYFLVGLGELGSSSQLTKLKRLTAVITW